MHEQLRAQYGDGNNSQTAGPAPQQAQSENGDYSVSSRSREEGGTAEAAGMNDSVQRSEQTENLGDTDSRRRPAFATDQKKRKGKKSGPVPRIQTFAEDRDDE